MIPAQAGHALNGHADTQQLATNPAEQNAKKQATAPITAQETEDITTETAKAAAPALTLTKAAEKRQGRALSVKTVRAKMENTSATQTTTRRAKTDVHLEIATQHATRAHATEQTRTLILTETAGITNAKLVIAHTAGRLLEQKSATTNVMMIVMD